jgi:hypothetical protein
MTGKGMGPWEVIFSLLETHTFACHISYTSKSGLIAKVRGIYTSIVLNHVKNSHDSTHFCEYPYFWVASPRSKKLD